MGIVIFEEPLKLVAVLVTAVPKDIDLVVCNVVAVAELPVIFIAQVPLAPVPLFSGYLPSKSTVKADKPFLPKVKIPVVVSQPKLVG